MSRFMRSDDMVDLRILLSVIETEEQPGVPTLQPCALQTSTHATQKDHPA
jgi:hypothetical protein